MHLTQFKSLVFISLVLASLPILFSPSENTNYIEKKKNQTLLIMQMMTDLFTNVKQGDQITFTIKLGPYVNEEIGRAHV